MAEADISPLKDHPGGTDEETKDAEGNASNTLEPTSVPVVLSGVNADNFMTKAGNCVIPELLLRRREDESDPQSNLTDLYVIGTLATTKDSDIAPIPFSYTALWGDLTIYGYALVNDPILCLKLKLAHTPTLFDYMKEDSAIIAAKMTIRINGHKEKNISQLNEEIRVGANARDLYPNQVFITIQDTEPPSTKQDKKVAKLQTRMYEATFIPDEGSDYPALGSQPCVHCVRMGRRTTNEHHGLPCLILNGTPRSALWIAPIKDVTFRNKRGPHILANLGASSLSLCDFRKVDIKVRYEDDPRNKTS